MAGKKIYCKLVFKIGITFKVLNQGFILRSWTYEDNKLLHIFGFGFLKQGYIEKGK